MSTPDLTGPPRAIPVVGQEAHAVGLRPGEALAGLGGLALIVGLALPWFGYVDVAARAVVGNDPTRSGWQAFAILDLVLFLIGALAVALPVLAITQRAPVLPVVVSVWSVPLGALAVFLILVRIASPPGDDSLVTVQWGAFAGLLGALLTLAGAWLALRDEGADHPPAP